jgi:hypothetical protein
MRHDSRYQRSWWATAVAIGQIVRQLLAPWRRTWRTTWGTWPDEVRAELPGTDLIPEPSWRYTHAISISTPCEDVWPWIAQVGQERGGFYSFERLENLLGCGVTNADGIVAEWQDPQVGDVVHLHPSAPPLRVALVDPGRTLVLRGAGPHDPTPSTDSLWGFHLVPDGPGRSRLIEYGRTMHGRSLSERLFLSTLLVEPIGFVMGREMLRSIRVRAEAANRVGARRTAPLVVTEDR